MPKYLTAAYYKALGTGLDLTGVSDFTLATTIADAEALIDSHCKVPSLAPFSVTDEIHDWNGDTRRIRPYCTPVPVTSVTTFRLQISTDSQGNMLSATVNPNDLVINHDEGWIEVVSMTTLTMGLTPVLINLGLNTVLVHVDYAAGYSFTTSAETLYDAGTHTTYNGLRPLWDSSVAAVVKVNGTTVTTGYTVNYSEGSVTFSPALQASDVVTAAYTYHVPDDVTRAAVVTTTALLGERALATAGMTGLEQALGGRSTQARRPKGTTGPRLPQRAADLLSNYVHRALGGV